MFTWYWFKVATTPDSALFGDCYTVSKLYWSWFLFFQFPLRFTLLQSKIINADNGNPDLFGNWVFSLQRDLDKLGLWANRWQMLFNPTNCYKMSVYRSRSPGVKDYTLYNQALVAVQQHHYLGVLLSSDVWWNSHVGKNVKKGNSLTLAGLLIFFVVVYLNINFKLNGGGESSARGLKNFSSFF